MSVATTTTNSDDNNNNNNNNDNNNVDGAYFKWRVPNDPMLEGNLNEIQSWSAESLENWTKFKAARECLKQLGREEDLQFVNFEAMSAVSRSCMRTVNEMFRDPNDGNGSIAERLEASLNKFDALRPSYHQIIAINGPLTQTFSNQLSKLFREAPELNRSLDILHTYVCAAHHGCWFIKFYNVMAREVARRLPDDEPGVLVLRARTTVER